MSKEFPLLNEFTAFVNERWRIHERRMASVPPPWTSDPILATYRFTNVRREDDRVTRWVHRWAADRTDDPDLWLAFYVARVFNRPATLAAVGWPLPWTAATQRRVRRALQIRQNANERLFNAAYMVTSRGYDGSKVDYYMAVFTALWERRRQLRPVEGDTLEAFAARLVTQHGIGGFMAAQVTADAKQYEPLRQATDWWTFARRGPGSHRGLNWVCGRDQHTHCNETEWKATLLRLMAVAQPKLVGVPRLDAQNGQSCLCEFSKYCKAKYGGGRIKQKFKPDVKGYTTL